MASWNEIVQEVAALASRSDAYDIVRRRKIDAVRQITGRDLVIYAADFTAKNPIKAQFTGPLAAIGLNDKDGFDEVTRNLPRDTALDVLLHSPGGSAEATESIVELLRARFSKIRFIIPNVAKSAATMMAMSGDELLLDERSELGPTDPQMLMIRDGQQIVAPAQAIKDQFQKAQDEINRDQSKLPSWVPILRQYGPSLLAECDNHLALARDLVSKWLERFMFAGEPDAALKANQISEYLANHNNFLSHSRRVGITDLQSLGVKVLDLRNYPELHEAIRDLYTALMLTFDNTGTFKIFENSKHEAHIYGVNIQVQGSAPASTPVVPQQPSQPRPRQTPSPKSPGSHQSDRRRRKH